MKKLLCLMLASSTLIGCAYEPQDLEPEDEDVGTAYGAFMSENALEKNALLDNGLTQNGVVRNGVVRNGVVRNGVVRNGVVRNGLINSTTTSTDVVNAMSTDNDDGRLARMLMKYVISCALPSNQSIVFDWTDSQSVVHEEIYYGSLGLAPDYGKNDAADLPIDQQEWLSACLAARTNYYGVTVTISIRGDIGALATDTTERGIFNKQEGAFWGNLFADPPTLKSCYNNANATNSRSKMRECAAGHDDGGSFSACGPIVRMGDCSSACTGSATVDGAFTNCDSGNTRIITTFLD